MSFGEQQPQTGGEQEGSRKERLEVLQQAIKAATEAGDFKSVQKLAFEAENIRKETEESSIETGPESVELAADTAGAGVETVGMEEDLSRIKEDAERDDTVSAADADAISARLRGAGSEPSAADRSVPESPSPEDVGTGTEDEPGSVEDAVIRTMVDAARAVRVGEDPDQSGYKSAWEAIPPTIRNTEGFRDKVVTSITEDRKSGEPAPEPVVESVSIGHEREKGEFDPIAFNNELVALKRDEEKRQATLDAMTPEQISAVARHIASVDERHLFSILGTFNEKPEIVTSPELTEKFSEMLSRGDVHVFDVERIATLPVSDTLFSEPSVREGIQSSIATSFRRDKDIPGNLPHVVKTIRMIAEKIKMTNDEFRSVAEKLRGSDAMSMFAREFGVKFD